MGTAFQGITRVGAEFIRTLAQREGRRFGKRWEPAGLRRLPSRAGTVGWRHRL